MRIITHGLDRWAVTAEWLGAERTVFVGTIFECLAWAKGNG